MSWFARERLPAGPKAGIERLLAPGEEALRWTATVGGGVLAVSRFALYAADAGPPSAADRAESPARRWGWEQLAKVGLAQLVLTVLPTVELAVWDDGTVVIEDDAPVQLVLARADRLTDVVHARVRRSVAASARLDLPETGGWLALRRVPGRDGLVRQLRLDAGAAADEAVLRPAVAALAGQLAQAAQVSARGR